MRRFLIITLIFCVSFGMHWVDSLQDFGFHLLRLKKEWVNNHLEIEAEIGAPTHAEFIWSFGFEKFPVLENDRFSSVESWRGNGTIVTRLHTTRVNAGLIKLMAWTYRPYYVAFELYVRNDKENVIRSYNNKCKYSAPFHFTKADHSAVRVQFACGTFNTEDSSGIYYGAESLDRSGDNRRYIESVSSHDTTLTRIDNLGSEYGHLLLTKTIKRNNSWLANQGGILSTFHMTQNDIYKERGPIFSIDYVIEDDKSFDGKTDNPFLSGVFSEVQFKANSGKFMKPHEQAYIYCRAIGYKIPDLSVYKQAENGSLMLLKHPKTVVNTRFSKSIHYIINFPTEQDAGTYVCVSTVDGHNKMNKVIAYFEPPLAPEIIEEETGRIKNSNQDSIKVKVKVPAEVNITCYMGSKSGKEIDSVPIELALKQKDMTHVVYYNFPWPKSRQWRGVSRKKMFCKVQNAYGEDWTEIGKRRRLPDESQLWA